MDDEIGKQRRQDAIDFNDELAGRETGRLKRFLPNNPRDAAEAAKDRREREFRSLLDQTLQDAEYRRLYDDAWGAVNDAQAAMDRAMLENARAKERLETLIAELEDRAAALDNGEKVFRSQDGNLYTARGRRLSNEEARGVEIRDDAPSYEQYRQASEALERARQRGHDLSEIQTNRIDPARDRLQDEDNPTSKDELRDMAQEMEQVHTDIRQSMAPGFEAAANPLPTQSAEPPLELATLGQFPSL